MTLPYVTCTVNTYGRFEKLREVLWCFLNQTYPNKKLLIFNQGTPFELDNYYEGVTVINSNKTYKQFSDINGRSFSYVDTEYVAFWDDDDLYLPSHLTNLMHHVGYENYVKPEKSYYETVDKLYTASNVFEASSIVKTETVRSVGFEEGKFCHRRWVNTSMLLVPSLEYIYRIDNTIAHVAHHQDDTATFILGNTDFGNGELSPKAVNFNPIFKKLCII